MQNSILWRRFKLDGIRSSPSEYTYAQPRMTILGSTFPWSQNRFGLRMKYGLQQARLYFRESRLGGVQSLGQPVWFSKICLLQQSAPATQHGQ